ncbi:MAG: spermidine synthase [Caulobacteraceae bacterium]|nr:spermidine synthase [Caulobacteraceae bacterium]
MSGSTELMNSRRSGSEKDLARLACARIAGRPSARVLIGGLGMGFTLSAALAELGPRAQVVVAELSPAVAAWARGPLAHIVGDSLSDPRVAVHEADVADLIASPGAGYDAILLDVDNGPGGLNREANNRLYAAPGLGASRRALRPGGVLAVWSAGPDRDFVNQLRRTGYAVEEVQVRANGNGKGARHVIWLATPT